MPEFQYTAIDSNGNTVQGRRNASTAEDFAGQLQDEALIPLEITRASAHTINTQSKNSRYKLSKFLTQKVSQEELQIFCRQMYTVIKAGVPLAISVARLAETSRDKNLARALQEVLVNLNKGRTLYQSLAGFPEIFNTFFVNLVRVGETTGKLDRVFLHLSEYLELEVDTRKKIKSAIRYPILVVVATVVALIVINIMVIPAFADFFKSFHGTLPFVTRILIAVSGFIINYWYLLVLFSMGVFFGFRYWTRTRQGEYVWAKFLLHVPIVGWIIHRIILARFARLYALVLRAGLTAVEGIELVGASTGNAYVARKIKTVSSLVERGNTIAKSLSQSSLFTPLVIQMITLGEDTGEVDRLLDDVADFYQRELSYDLVRLSDAIEPILLIIMGVMVLILGLGVFLPLWDLASVARVR
ncbi:pilus assembly protein PilC [Legionella adelaidensis]|uniref:Pilus assembly protein PilC n=1 Tax=Legionella adelaidensis TaxID=45056 RepID=A0A0W0R181_9GAMM|nr:type II secretion system F family protein [Legionella adelaidensis]KTC64823.1 pilus assembly protein PilC [Legionella adelaidensis]